MTDELEIKPAAADVTQSGRPLSCRQGIVEPRVKPGLPGSVIADRKKGTELTHETLRCE
jgi:hypothetical protein